MQFENPIDYDLENYIRKHFIEGFSSVILKALEILISINDKEIETKLLNMVLGSDNQEASMVQDTFVNTLEKSVIKAIELHGLKLSSDTTLRESTEMLCCLFFILYLEDYTFLRNLLDSDLEPFEKLDIIFSEYSLLEEGETFSLMEEIDDNLFERMSSLADEKMSLDLEEDLDPEKKVLNDFKLFTKFVGKDTLGLSLVETGYVAGSSLSVYLPNPDVQELFSRKMEPIDIVNLVSVIMLSRESLNGIIFTLDKNLSTYLSTYNEVPSLKDRIGILVSDFVEFKRVIEGAEK